MVVHDRTKNTHPETEMKTRTSKAATTNFISKIHKMHVTSNLHLQSKTIYPAPCFVSAKSNIITDHKNTENMNIKIFKFYRFPTVRHTHRDTHTHIQSTLSLKVIHLYVVHEKI